MLNPLVILQKRPEVSIIDFRLTSRFVGPVEWQTNFSELLTCCGSYH